MKKLLVTLFIAAAIVSSVGVLSAQDAAKKADPWADYRFLLGEWVADTPADQGSGMCNFALDLQDKVIVRKNHAESPATKDRPATIHDDLMVMFLAGDAVNANYYDCEDHVINYTATFSTNKDTLAFVSPADPKAPRFRLSYIKQGETKLAGTFEFAPPGKPDAFAPYLKWTMSRK